METLHHRLVDTAFAEISQTDGAAVGCVKHVALEMLHREIVDLHKRLALAHGLPLGIGHLMLLYLDVIFFRKVSQRVPVAQLLMLHYEVDGAATLAATETFTYAFGTRHGE